MAEDDKLHIVMFPWLAFGHLIPNLELAKLIAGKGHLVSFVSTPRNIDRLPKLPPSFAALIKFVKFPLPKVPNLPDDAEATIDVPYNVVPFLKKAYDGLQEPITRFLQSSNPDWILYDFAPYWVGSIASKLGIRSSFFCIYPASVMGFCGPPSVLMGNDSIRTKPEDFTVLPPWVSFSTTIACPSFETMRISDALVPNESGVPDLYRVGASIQNCDLVTIRSCSQFEPEWIQLLENIYQKPVLPVGQLPKTAVDGGDENDTWQWMKDWLDKQSKGTVAYVAFGSEVKPNQEEVREIALGLEKSQLPFFWVLRVQRGPIDPEVLKLPEGFEERTQGRGVVCTSWAPQMKILGHESVGGFLTHAGTSSVVEAVQEEKPLVLLPFLADQGLYARALEEKKMAYVIQRDDQTGWFTSESVAESLRLVIIEEEGWIYREKIKEMKDLFANGNRQERPRLNTRVLEEKKMGYSVPRNEEDGSCTSDSVAESLRLVVMKEEGRIYREKIKEIKDLFVNTERQERYVESLLAYLKTHRNPKPEA